MSKRLALIAGGGGAIGVATCRRLGQQGYVVVCAGRDRARLQNELGSSADVLVEVELTEEASVREQLGPYAHADVLVYNAGRIDLLPFAETSSRVFTASWQTNVLGAFHCAQLVLPAMAARADGAMLFMGATSSLRGGARTHAFSSAKHALRGLASSLAKEYGPKGIHVAHIVIDGKVWGARTMERFPTVTREACLDPSAVADGVAWLLAQPRSGFSFELDLRPHAEPW